MQVLLALIFGAAVGALFHVVLGGRELRGMLLGPIVGALVGGGVWVWLTWSGLTTLDPPLWLLSAAAPLVVTPIVLVIVTKLRVRSDARERNRVGIG